MMYAWATPEYLLWKMSLGQIVYYYRCALDIKYGKPKENGDRLADKSYGELKDEKEKMILDGLIEASEEQKVELRRKWGDI